MAEQWPHFSPFQSTDPNWRFTALNLAFGSILTPLLGLALAMGAALLVRRRATLRVLGVISLLAGIAAGAGVFLLVRDFRTLSSSMDLAAREGFRITGWKAIGLGGLVCLVLLWLGFASWIAAGRLWIEPDPGRRGGLVVGQ